MGCYCSYLLPNRRVEHPKSKSTQVRDHHGNPVSALPSFFLPSIHFYDSTVSSPRFLFPFPTRCSHADCGPSSSPPPLSLGQLDNHFVNTLNLKKKKRRRRRNHGMKSRCGWSAFRSPPSYAAACFFTRKKIPLSVIYILHRP